MATDSSRREKLRMKMNLTRKIFIAVMSIFLFIMLVQLVIQNNFLENIYIHTKVGKVEAMVEDVESQISSRPFTSIDFNDLSSPFNDDLNTSVLFFSHEPMIQNIDWFESYNYATVHLNESILSKTEPYNTAEQTNVIHVIIDPAVNELGQFRDFVPEFTTGHRLSGKGYRVFGADYVFPVELYVDDEPVILRKASLDQELFKDSTPVIFEGTMTSFNLVVREQGIFSYQHERLHEEYYTLLREGTISYPISHEKQQVSYDFIEEETGFLIFVKYGVVLSSDGILVQYITLSTMENVNDAFRILNSYYFYIFAIQLLLALILVYYFSRKVTRPVLQLSNMADKISSQDFTTQLDIKTGDELELLSNNLHSISDRLSKVIGDLESSELRMRNMLSGLSHEFKTPLGIISGFLEIVQDGVGTEPDAHYLNAIDSEVRRLDGLVRETIELSQLESGEYVYAPCNFYIKDVILRNLKRSETLLSDNDMRIQIAGKDHLVHGDPGRLDQVFLNLFSNAAAYSPKSETLQIRLEDIGESIKISVLNSGITLPEEALEHIWDRFYRTDKSRHRSSGGSGLGLTIVKNIFELHHSQFGVENQMNSVCFYFTLKKGTSN